jgi:phosphoribosylformylglycinamidine synthase subunit PurS
LAEILAQVLINVHLKNEILDPQGRAVLGAITRLGLQNISDVRQGKQFILNISGEVTDLILNEIKKIGSTLLSNPVIEDFTIEVKE